MSTYNIINTWFEKFWPFFFTTLYLLIYQNFMSLKVIKFSNFSFSMYVIPLPLFSFYCNNWNYQFDVFDIKMHLYKWLLKSLGLFYGLTMFLQCKATVIFFFFTITLYKKLQTVWCSFHCYSTQPWFLRYLGSRKLTLFRS